jgi:hypothetical protein
MIKRYDIQPRRRRSTTNDADPKAADDLDRTGPPIAPATVTLEDK